MKVSMEKKTPARSRPMATGSNAFSSIRSTASYSSDVSDTYRGAAQASHGAYSSLGGASEDSPRGFPDSGAPPSSKHPGGFHPPGPARQGSASFRAGHPQQSSYRRRIGRPGVSAASTSEPGAPDGRPRTEANQRWPGYPLSELKTAGYNAVQLQQVGHTAADLKTAGFNPSELKAAGFGAADLRAARFRAAELKAVGFGVLELREAKFRAVDLKNAGFSVSELKEVDHTAAEMKAAGYSAKELKAAKYKASELRKAGFTLLQLKEAHFGASDLRQAGYPAADPIAVGYSFGDLKAGGYSPAELLRAAGYTAAELTTLRYTVYDLIAGGFPYIELRPLGYRLDELTEAGYKPTEQDLLEERDNIQVKVDLPLEITLVPGILRRERIATVKLQLTVERKPDVDFILFEA